MSNRPLLFVFRVRWKSVTIKTMHFGRLIRGGDSMADRLVYLDHAATTPVDERVVVAMLPYFTEFYGNPSSIHRAGRAALEALDDARETLASVLGANRKEIIFTGGGS